MTGSDGYIGSVMAKMLIDRGYDVLGCDTGFFRGRDFVEMEYNLPTVGVDIRDIAESDVDGADAFIHLAALSNDPMGELDPKLTDEINHIASVGLARLCKRIGCERFLYASSCSMYGVSAADQALTEEAPFNPVSAYALSKVEAERSISRLADRHFSPVFLRNATAYGPSPRMRFDLVLNNLVGWGFATGKVRIMSDGTPWRPLVHVEDISQAFLAALEAPRDMIHNQAFNVGADSQNFKVREIAGFVEKTIPDCKIEYAHNAAPDPRSYRVDFSKIATILPAFKPRWTVEQGVRQLLHIFKTRGLTRQEFESDEYTRLKKLKHLLMTGRLLEDLRWKRLG
jgi:nucleoside-diphosphate-sugar epimerase